MKEVASSIVILAAVFILISAEYFDSLLFWIIGVIMLTDGTILFMAFMFFPDKFSDWVSRVFAAY